jgi:hypothetical protein
VGHAALIKKKFVVTCEALNSDIDVSVPVVVPETSPSHCGTCYELALF